MGTVDLYVPAKGNWFSPTQKQNALFNVWNRIVAEEIDLEAFEAEPEPSYYSRKLNKQVIKCEYDIRFNFSLDFDPKAKRCDRHNLDVVRDNIYKEERQRVIPCVTSQNYGHRRYDMEGYPLKSHKRLNVMSEVLRRFRVNVKPSKKLPEEFQCAQL